MSIKPTPYLIVPLEPTAKTTYTIADYIEETILVDDYIIECESPYVALTVKTATTFRLEPTINSPAFPNRVYLKFMRAVTPAQ